jgi:predicted NAD-dependent protein-ADP-ribosyltransferase YbiA (DUF1768 family)
MGAASAGTSRARCTSGRAAADRTKRSRTSRRRRSSWPTWHAELGDVTFATGEHAFQAAKAATLDEHEAIQTARTPMDAKQAGRRAALPRDWSSRRAHVMLTVVRAKVRRRRAARCCCRPATRCLPRTPRTTRCGAAERDRSGGYTGANQLGRVLMRARDELRAQP